MALREIYSKPGTVVDQEVLVTALQAGATRSAALDVSYPEPLPRLPSLLVGQEHGENPAGGRSIPAAGRGLAEA